MPGRGNDAGCTGEDSSQVRNGGTPLFVAGVSPSSGRAEHRTQVARERWAVHQCVCLGNGSAALCDRAQVLQTNAPLAAGHAGSAASASTFSPPRDGELEVVMVVVRLHLQVLLHRQITRRAACSI